MSKKKITLKHVSKVEGTKYDTIKHWNQKRKMLLKLGVEKAVELGLIPDPR